MFAIEHVPDPSRDRGHAVVVVPPFAEEMNRSRRMATLQAQRLAEEGFRVVVFDLFGTGDSEGDFGDARWEAWSEDVRSIVEWVRGRGADRCSLLAIRLGALLAVDPRVVSAGLEHVVCWQPTTSGKVFLRQFLRLRLVGGLLGNKQGGESVDDLLSRLAAGESLEVAGYEIASPLALAIQERSFEPPAAAALPPFRWFDLVADDAAPLSPATAGALKRWQAAGVAIEAAGVPGDPFWSLQETTIAPQLIAATARAFVGH